MTGLARPIIATVTVATLAIGGYLKGHNTDTKTTPATVSASTSVVRGKLYRLDAVANSYPASGILVRLNHPSYGPSSPSYSNQDGMYYLYNVPSGQFVLEIWLTQTNALRFNIIVREQPYTDIAPIRVP